MQRALIASFVAVVLALFAAPSPASAQSIDEAWDKATPPAKPELAKVKADPATTALLVLDIEERTCNDKRPRCLETVPRIAAIMKKARAAGMPVVHSLTPLGKPETILPPAKPAKGEPIVQSSVDKFWNTELEEILAKKGVKRVIVTGTAAHGAVLHTATAAGFRKLDVILPLDTLSAEDLYTEQASVMLLKTGPATRERITLTRSDMIAMP